MDALAPSVLAQELKKLCCVRHAPATLAATTPAVRGCAASLYSTHLHSSSVSLECVCEQGERERRAHAQLAVSAAPFAEPASLAFCLLSSKAHCGDSSTRPLRSKQQSYGPAPHRQVQTPQCCYHTVVSAQPLLTASPLPLLLPLPLVATAAHRSPVPQAAFAHPICHTSNCSGVSALVLSTAQAHVVCSGAGTQEEVCAVEEAAGASET